VGRIDDFGAVQGVEITVLVDNSADLMVESTETVRRFTKEPLLAEHGLAAMIDLEESGVRILWDAGISQMALLENAERMEIDLTAVDKIALSHGHRDHYAAMTPVIRQVAGKPEPREWAKDAPVDEIRTWVEGHKVPLIAHPAAFRERWGIGEDGKKHGPHNVPREEWEAAGAEIVLSAGPYRLAPGCWTTGAIPRKSFEQSGIPSSLAYREGDEFIPDFLEDDQAVVIHVQDKGLVVLTGCAHSGVINTVRYAREISGVDRVFAILGGFHLGRAKDDEIERTIDEFVGMIPEMVVPAHCTGFKAMARFAERMPDQFVQGVVGTRYLLRRE
jgi:7,8-dihydropterin-6-yl-methyl-4-(beta-D-ribofuranosyl)aminobenzene 5'-phosphate synthase